MGSLTADELVALATDLRRRHDEMRGLIDQVATANTEVELNGSALVSIPTGVLADIRRIASS